MSTLTSFLRAHWAEIAAMLLVLLAALPVVALLGHVVALVRSYIEARIERRARPDPVITSAGQFVWEDRSWRGEAVANGKEIVLSADDVGGRPNPAMIERLPVILERLALLEQIARESVSAIGPDYELDQITDDDSAEFALGFSWDDESWGETVYVYFRGNSVVRWDSVD